ncbi:ABC transporter permease subunit [Paenibacillus tengchongensis]|uniref:ABC transporter permease subunit n=1 Tax=Paenibacillus tengchongensis TaxID=2608684 RepID=UPI00124EAC9C|nr:ABC transporter permease subunit [Paenibacillus tengchongensis]
MNTLTGYELRKLIRRKSTLFGLLGILIVSVLCTVVPAFHEQSYDADGKVTGLAAIKQEKHYARNFRGDLTPEVFSGTVAHYQQILRTADRVTDGGISYLGNEGFFATYPDYPILGLLRSGFSPTTEYDYFVVDTLAPEKAATFYEQRTAYIEGYLEQNPEGITYSDADKATFRQMNERISVPLKFDYAKGWYIILVNSSIFFLIACFVLSICAAPVFSSEYQSGADAIILSTRHGRGKLIRAKINAALLFSSGMFLLGWLIVLALALSIYGASGWDSSFQILDTRHLFSPYPFTVLGAFLLTTLIGWLACLAMVSFTLLLSSRMRTPFSVMIWCVVLLFTPLFIPESKEQLFNHLLALLPGRQTEIFETFRGYDLLHLLGLSVPLPYAIGWTALLMTVLCLPFAWRGFRKHEVS